MDGRRERIRTSSALRSGTPGVTNALAPSGACGISHLAVGRSNAFTGSAGVACDDRGYITVDDALATSVAGIWALGDYNGRGAFTHTSYNDYEIVAANLLDGASRRVSDRITAYALYIDPPLGRAGMTVAQAKKAGRRVLVGERPMTRVARAVLTTPRRLIAVSAATATIASGRAKSGAA